MNIKYIFLSMFFLFECQASAMFWSIPQELWESKAQKQVRLNRTLAVSIQLGQTTRAISFMDQGAQVDSIDPKTHLRPLYHAINFNRLDLITELVARGAQIDSASSLYKGAKSTQLYYHGTPLQYAASKYNVAAVERLLWTVPQSTINDIPETPPRETIIEQQIAFISKILNNQSQEYHNKKTEWRTDLPCALVTSARPIPLIKKKKAHRIIELLAPEYINQHRQGIEAYLAQDTPE